MNAYRQGFEDALAGRPVRERRHGAVDQEYLAGYREGTHEAALARESEPDRAEEHLPFQVGDVVTWEVRSTHGRSVTYSQREGTLLGIDPATEKATVRLENGHLRHVSCERLRYVR